MTSRRSWLPRLKSRPAVNPSRCECSSICHSIIHICHIIIHICLQVRVQQGKDDVTYVYDDVTYVCSRCECSREKSQGTC